MATKPVDTGTVLAMKTRNRTFPDLGKIVLTTLVPKPGGGLRVDRLSLPANSMHIAALKAAGRTVRRVK